jgi:hypothetical protein
MDQEVSRIRTNQELEELYRTHLVADFKRIWLERLGPVLRMDTKGWLRKFLKVGQKVEENWEGAD